MAPFEKFQKPLILAFEANSALSRENETKIVKITQSVYMYNMMLCNIFLKSIFVL